MRSFCINRDARFAASQTCFQVLVSLIVLVCLSTRGGVVFTNILSFDGINGTSPNGLLLQVGDGSFYGTMSGFPSNRDSVFNLSSSGVLKTVAWFSQTNGSDPSSSLVQTPDGSVYGTTWLGGSGQWGTVFRILTDGTLESLQAFNGTNGAGPFCVVLGPDDALYGITRSGGLGYNGQGTGFGTVFRIDTNGVSNTLVAFNGTNGYSPTSLILARDGMFYGTTAGGGALYGSLPSGSLPGYGTVFKMSLDGSLSTLFSFDGTNGAQVFGVTEATDGNLYGVTGLGGTTSLNTPTFGNGTAFRMTKSGVLNTLAEFPSTNHYPYSIIQGGDGNFYGGTLNPASIFQLNPGGVLNFVDTFANGVYALDGLMRSVDGSLYGTTGFADSHHYGTIFRLIFLPDPPLLQSVTQANGFFNFTWNASLGRSYQVQYAVDLGQVAWTNLGSPILATNTMVSFSGITSSGTNCLYRVMLLP